MKALDEPLRLPLNRPTAIEPPIELDSLRRTRPVCPVVLQTGAPAYLVTRYDDVRTVLSDPRFSRAALRAVADRQLMGIEETEGQLLDLDPPEHTRLRRILSEGFTSRHVARMRQRIQQLTDEMLTAVSQMQPPVDLHAAFISPFPLAVICDLLGIPAQSRARVRDWTLAVTDVENLERSQQAAAEIFSYIAELAEAKRKQPADDLLSNLVTACDAGRLRQAEVVTMVSSLAIGGHETTVTSLGRGIVHILRDPELYRSLATDNARTTRVIDEMLRLAPAVQFALPRVATCDVEISGTRIPAGSLVVACLTSANRDTGCFPNPEQLALDRGNMQHLSFGHGPHYCMGASLAREELSTAITGLATRFPDLRLAVAEQDLRWNSSLITEGLLELWVTW